MSSTPTGTSSRPEEPSGPGRSGVRRPGEPGARAGHRAGGWLRRGFAHRPPKRALVLSGWALLPLRAFLGFTFCFAGLQKLANPNFFSTTDPAGIYAQMVASNRISPLHPLLGHLLRFSTPIGVLIALAELAVGLGVLVGLWTRVAALGGALLSLTLFLTVSYHSSPYYTGADIVFLFAWLPFILAGSGGVLSFDAAISARVRSEAGRGPGTPVAVPFAVVQHICGQFDGGRCAARSGQRCDPAPCPYLRDVIDRAPGESPAPGALGRREVVLGGAAAAAVGVAGLAVAGAAVAIGRAAGGTKPLPTSVALPPVTTDTAPTTTTTTGAPSSATSTTPAPTTPPGVDVGPAKAVPVGGSAHFTDPTTRTPSLVIQLHEDRFVAYDAVCPHAGCTVSYLAPERIIACPCHGSEFDPATGAVVQGPATRGLRVLGIAKGPNGDLYVKG